MSSCIFFLLILTPSEPNNAKKYTGLHFYLYYHKYFTQAGVIIAERSGVEKFVVLLSASVLFGDVLVVAAARYIARLW